MGHATAPDAKLVLIATNLAETEGVQGFPSMFIGEQFAVSRYPGFRHQPELRCYGTVSQLCCRHTVARFDQVYRQAAANHVTVVSSSGDSGSADINKQGRVFPIPTVNWPSSDALVAAVWWRWDPLISAAGFFQCLSSGTPFAGCFAAFLNFTTELGRTEAVWNEVFGVTGGRSFLFSAPSFQSNIPKGVLQGRWGLPDVSWNAA
jgi:subtilase family serine protease